MRQVKCINNSGGRFFLTIEALYDVIEETENHYKVRSDSGLLYWYPRRCFTKTEKKVDQTDFIVSERAIIKDALQNLLGDVEERINLCMTNKRYKEGIQPVEYASRIQELLKKFES